MFSRNRLVSEKRLLDGRISVSYVFISGGSGVETSRNEEITEEVFVAKFGKKPKGKNLPICDNFQQKGVIP